MLLTYFFLFVVGCIMGSFLSVFTYRLVLGQDFLRGRSKCPKCKRKIVWKDNIPLLSYLLLKGKCRKCKKNISVRYPLLELSSGFLFVGTALKALSCRELISINDLPLDVICKFTSQNFLIGLIIILILILLLISVFIIDLEYMIIPDSIIFVSLLIFYLFTAIYFSSQLFTFLLSGFIASLFLLALNLITMGRGMGLGDVKFAIFGGFILGFRLTMVWMFLAFLIGAIIGVMLLSLKKAKLGKHIPFGPYLVISFILVLFFGTSLYNILNLPF